LGRSKFALDLTASTQREILGCEVYLRGRKEKNSFQIAAGEEGTNRNADLSKGMAGTARKTGLPDCCI
jgi:hypothetical protein